jgi:hypothetical protein
MAITTLKQLNTALNSTSQKITWQKLSVSTQVAGAATSLWRLTTFPVAGAIPSAATNIMSNLTTGCFTFDADLPGKDRYLAGASSLVATAGTGIMLYDRLMTRGGLNGTLTDWQWVGGLDLEGVEVSNMVERVGRDDFSDVQWFLEWYTTTGSNPVTVDLSYVTKGWVSYPQNMAMLSLPASVGASRLYPLVGINGEPMMGIDAIRLSASTGTAGNFGITAMRPLGMLSNILPQTVYEHDWQTLPLTKIPSQACVFPVAYPTGSTTGIIGGTIEVVQG